MKHSWRAFSLLNSLKFERAFPLAALLSLFLFCFCAVVSAQTENSGTDAKVQQLYREAKAAEAQGDLSTAAEKYESLLQVAPKLAAAYNNLGALYLRQKDYKKAAAVLERGLKIDPRMSSASALLGIALYESGEYAAARSRLEATLRANPKDDNAEMFLANDLIKMGELSAAASHLEQISSRQPKNQEVLYLLGKVHMKLSEQALAKLNAIDSNSVWVHEISGEVMESMKNYDGALIEYKKAVEMGPDQPGVHFLLGNAYWSLSKWSDAVQEFKIELSNDPSNCTAQWKMGNAILEQHESPEEALDDVNKALAICPNLVQARVDRARALTRLDRNEEAVEDLRVAEKVSPEEPSIHFLLGHALRSLGHMEESRVEMEAFTKLEESARSATAERAKQVLQNSNENTSPNQTSPNQ
jgi:tetratricopeptide (TPR) repeat protein